MEDSASTYELEKVAVDLDHMEWAPYNRNLLKLQGHKETSVLRL